MRKGIGQAKALIGLLGACESRCAMGSAAHLSAAGPGDARLASRFGHCRLQEVAALVGHLSEPGRGNSQAGASITSQFGGHMTSLFDTARAKAEWIRMGRNLVAVEGALLRADLRSICATPICARTPLEIAGASNRLPSLLEPLALDAAETGSPIIQRENRPQPILVPFSCAIVPDHLSRRRHAVGRGRAFGRRSPRAFQRGNMGPGRRKLFVGRDRCVRLRVITSARTGHE